MAIKIMSIFGTRPEAIKMLPLVKCIATTEGFEGKVCITAQHREMLDQVMNVFGVSADYDLNLMRPKQTLTSITTDVISGLTAIFATEQPDLVLVHGDTTTSFAAAMAAFYQQIPVGHVEAGLRTYNMYSPFPEETNRCLTTRLTTLHFAPTALNVHNLLKENITEHIYQTGNTVIDALATTVRDGYVFKNSKLRQIDFTSKRTIIATVHRRENLGAPMRQIFSAILAIADEFSDTQVIYPVHKNPAVSDVAHEMLDKHPRIHLIDPVDVEDMHNLISKSYMVLTDSGGLQEEAPALGKPVLVLRTETERPEAVAAGVVRVVGIETSKIFEAAHLLLTDKPTYLQMSHAINPYGDGNASRRICQAITRYFDI
ncbi:MAG: UDP-N-acetylglucosamine 2-epimerase (non-hydrolyzing) [Nitrososphaerota archaeon]|jgi:UDP-N-acetylglucosamine 2-epimerase (non-hydrolysing)|nr:UDP-N-acetylglucosamine 2-epimerase (non-hydrolyzing) [Nitrososphaerota archaeon]